MSTRSTSGIVRYGGTSAATVPASDSPQPSNAMPALGRAKERMRTSDRHDVGPAPEDTSSSASTASSR
jgi:hypothetical protein